MKFWESPQTRKLFTKQKTESSKAKSFLLIREYPLLPFLSLFHKYNVRLIRRTRKSRMNHAKKCQRLSKKEVIHYQYCPRKKLQLDNYRETRTNKRNNLSKSRKLRIPHIWLQCTSSLHFSLRRDQKTSSCNQEERRNYPKISCIQVPSNTQEQKYPRNMEYLKGLLSTRLTNRHFKKALENGKN